MFRVEAFEAIPHLPEPIALTIGNFDGVHLGHREILKKLREEAGQDGSIVVLTFTNHPSAFFNPSKKKKLLMTHEEKLQALEKRGVDCVISLSFNEKLANQSYREFLSHLHRHLPFGHLILGEGASLGKGREGTQELLEDLGISLGFQALFVAKKKHQGEAISSERIRLALHAEDPHLAADLLGN